MFKMLMPALLLAAGAAAAEPAYFSAKVDGQLTIGPGGEVVDVTLEDAGWMGEDVVQGYERKIRAWRFKPVLEDGKPVNAVGRMALSLVAVRDDEARTAHFAIRRAVFLDPPGAGQPPGEGRKLRIPAFPAEAVHSGTGANIMLVAELDGEGDVRRVAAESVHLTGNVPKQKFKYFGKQFRRAAEQAASQWRFDHLAGEGIVRIPMVFTVSRSPQAPGWQRIHPFRIEPPAWVRQVDAPPRDLAANGEGSRRLQLLTPLDEAGG